MSRFEEEENHNVYTKNGGQEFTDAEKRKAVEVVRMNNTHKCATAINECKKDSNAQCKHGYSQTETIPKTYVNEVTNRIIY